MINKEVVEEDTPNTRAANDLIPFTINFHPVKNSIIIHLIQILALLIFLVNRPLFSFKEADRNHRTFLVKVTLPSNKEPGTFRCSRKRCLSCPFVVSRISVTGPRSTLNITDHSNCTTSNIIYCIQCSNCNKLYIGETGRRSGDLIRDHLYDIHKNDLSKPVSRHFSSSNHSIFIFVAFGLICSYGINVRFNF